MAPPPDDAIYVLSLVNMTQAFAEWDRQWREDPDAFESDVKRLIRGDTPLTYGESAARTFIGMLGEVGVRHASPFGGG